MIPYLPEGTVYGTLLNVRREQALWAAPGDIFHADYGPLGSVAFRFA